MGGREKKNLEEFGYQKRGALEQKKKFFADFLCSSGGPNPSGKESSESFWACDGGGGYQGMLFGQGVTGGTQRKYIRGFFFFFFSAGFNAL